MNIFFTIISRTVPTNGKEKKHVEIPNYKIETCDNEFVEIMDVDDAEALAADITSEFGKIMNWVRNMMILVIISLPAFSEARSIVFPEFAPFYTSLRDKQSPPPPPDVAQGPIQFVKPKERGDVMPPL
ncbi:hypothetical protein C2S51_000308 [Perilla frutescens var. frutescens]|nr:hypothetical protein C2S51_000308 [Perilla frutescens var. frutescens]